MPRRARLLLTLVALLPACSKGAAPYADRSYAPTSPSMSVAAPVPAEAATRAAKDDAFSS